MKTDTYSLEQAPTGWALTPCHITSIRPGDTVFHGGVLSAVSRNSIRKGFMGVTLFGDSYRLGTRSVLRATHTNPKTKD